MRKGEKKIRQGVKKWVSDDRSGEKGRLSIKEGEELSLYGGDGEFGQEK